MEEEAGGRRSRPVAAGRRCSPAQGGGQPGAAALAGAGRRSPARRRGGAGEGRGGSAARRERAERARDGLVGPRGGTGSGDTWRHATGAERRRDFVRPGRTCPATARGVFLGFRGEEEEEFRRGL